MSPGDDIWCYRSGYITIIVIIIIIMYTCKNEMKNLQLHGREGCFGSTSPQCYILIHPPDSDEHPP